MVVVNKKGETWSSVCVCEQRVGERNNRRRVHVTWSAELIRSSARDKQLVRVNVFSSSFRQQFVAYLLANLLREWATLFSFLCYYSNNNMWRGGIGLLDLPTRFALNRYLLWMILYVRTRICTSSTHYHHGKILTTSVIFGSIFRLQCTAN